MDTQTWILLGIGIGICVLIAIGIISLFHINPREED